jgi:hypothetical protein
MKSRAGRIKLRERRRRRHRHRWETRHGQKTIVNLYYDTWINRAGDMTDVPLAADFSFRGPVASFDDTPRLV